VGVNTLQKKSLYQIGATLEQARSATYDFRFEEALQSELNEPQHERLKRMVLAEMGKVSSKIIEAESWLRAVQEDVD
jgi:hypothetical protein